MTLGNPNQPEVPPVGGLLVSSGTTQPKAGLYTTEFWLTLAAIVAGVVLIVAGKTEIGGAILVTSIPGYALSRGRAKGGA